MNALIAWIGGGEDPGVHHHDHQPQDVTREEFEEIRRRQDNLIERVEFVEAIVRAISARAKRDA